MFSNNNPNSDGMITYIPPTDLLSPLGYNNYIKEFSLYKYDIGLSFKILVRSFNNSQVKKNIKDDLFTLLNEKPKVKGNGKELTFEFAFDVDPLQIPKIAADMCAYCFSKKFKLSTFVIFT